MSQAAKSLVRVMSVAIVVVGVFAVAPSFAQSPDGPPPGMGPHRPPMERAMGMAGMHRWWNDAQAIEKFKLTDTQRKAMDDIYQQHRVVLIDLHASLEKEETAMEPLMSADQPDEGKILAQIDRVAQARAELEKANARMLLGIRKELTPEQWKQLQADRAARHANAPGGSGPNAMHRWRGGPGGGGTPGAPNGPGVPDGPGMD